MIHDFEIWAAERAETNSLNELENATLAIEASWYLDRLLNQVANREPLLPALGGQPLRIRQNVENEIKALRTYNVKPLFVFDGVSVGKSNAPFARSDEAARLNGEAWDLYNQHLAEQAVAAFGKRIAQPTDCFRLLQSILHGADVPFVVAPYSALGQLVYLMRRGEEYIDAVAGPSDLLLFDVDKVITDVDFQRNEFTWVRRQTWIDDLGLGSADQFVDACMLSGCELLEPLPILTRSQSNRKVQHLPQVLDLMKHPLKSGFAVCKQAQEDPEMRRSDYLNRYRRHRLAVKHQVVMTSEGKVEPFEADDVPSDLHEVIGQRLPDELYYYLFEGAIGPRILNQLTSQQIYETAPPDGGESDEYRNLVQDRLTPIRATSLSLLSHSLTRAYQHHNVKLQSWFDPNTETVIRISETPNQAPIVSKWTVSEETFEKFLTNDSSKVSIRTALHALEDEAFRAETLAKGRADSPRLHTSSEVAANTLWRFLHLRGYVDEKHELTPWGVVLNAILSSQGESDSDDVNESLTLAVELLRLDLLNYSNLSITSSGAPIHGTETDRRNCLFLSQIASLQKLKHDAIGYTGPLSRNLLSFNSMVEAIRRVLRDLEEMTLATLLLNGDADREAINLTQIGLGLPFLLPKECCLGIAMKHYLDELAALDSSKMAKAKESLKAKGPREWFPYALDFSGDLEKAFLMWDSIYNGVLKACELDLMSASDKETWDSVDKWVQERR